MIDYETYNKINELILKRDFQKLQEFVDKEKNKYYLEVARESLLEYVKSSSSSLYAYIDDKLVISDGYTGFYILNSDELLNKDIRKNSGGYPGTFAEKKLIVRVKTILNKTVEKCDLKVGEVAPLREDKRILLIGSEDGKVYHWFNRKLYEESLKILGENTAVTIHSEKDKPAFVAKSPKGLCFTAGIRND